MVEDLPEGERPRRILYLASGGHLAPLVLCEALPPTAPCSLVFTEIDPTVQGAISLQLQNLAAAEVARNDAWQAAEIAFVTVANDPGRVHAVLERAVRWIETHHPEVQVVDWHIEVF